MGHELVLLGAAFLSPLIAVYVLVLAVLSPVLAEHSDKLFGSQEVSS